MLLGKIKPIGIAIVGVGYWGRIILRSLTKAKGVILVGFSDADSNNLKEISEIYPCAVGEMDYRRLLEMQEVQAIIVATPPTSHRRIAMDAMEAGKDVLVEKPFTTRRTDALELVKYAMIHGRILGVDYTYLYNPYILEISTILNSGKIGSIRSLEYIRINTCGVRHNVDVLQDLVSHDFSISDFLLGSKVPERINAVGEIASEWNRCTRAKMSLCFNGNLLSTHHVDCYGAEKIRELVVRGTAGTLVYRAEGSDEGLYLIGLDDDNKQVLDRQSSLAIPMDSDALTTELEHFASCIRERRQPLSDGWLAVRVLESVEACRSVLGNAYISSSCPK
ncbi:putative oxidoreductase YdgJ [bacterium BMS3Bbin04]|nr:putative oxidoreductase YdgJ [bacterium BMS3Bbin04]